MFGVGWTESLVILVVALLVLGPNKLPDIAKGLGKGIRDFRKAMNSFDDEPEPPRPAAWSTPTQAQAPTQAPQAALPTPPAVPPEPAPPPAFTPAAAPPSPNAYSSGWPAPPAPSQAPAETPPTERTVSGKTPA